MRFLRFLFYFLLSLILHWEWSIPAWILLICHFVFGISIWWFVGAFVLYVVFVRLYVHFIGGMIRLGNADEAPKDNKNPYSHGYYKNSSKKEDLQTISSGSDTDRKDE